MTDVLFEVKNKAGIITLNRPEKINALTHQMIATIADTLQSWKTDPQVEMVLMEGAGTKGFCAGGDMRYYYDNRKDALQIAKKFFPSEYELDLEIINYPKPITALLTGVVMGGGVGISYGADFKIVTEKTKWAMPEVNIGFFPDVGASYFLNRIPSSLARYMALTGKMIFADDVCFLGYAEAKVSSETLELIKKELIESTQTKDHSFIKTVIAKYALDPAHGYLQNHSKLIDTYFSKKDLHDIFSGLEKGASGGDIWAEETLAELKGKSVFSQMLVLKQLEKAKDFTIEECFDLELNLSYNFMDNPDFFEGLRSVLVDKDKPNWHYQSPADVPEEVIETYLTHRP